MLLYSASEKYITETCQHKENEVRRFQILLKWSYHLEWLIYLHITVMKSILRLHKVTLHGRFVQHAVICWNLKYEFLPQYDMANA